MPLLKSNSTAKTLNISAADGIIQALKQISTYPDRYVAYAGYAKDGSQLKKQEPYRIYRYYSGAQLETISIPTGQHFCITSCDLLLLGAPGESISVFDQGFGTDQLIIEYWTTAGESKHWYFNPPRTIKGSFDINATGAGLYIWLNGFLEQD
jgi:hypothetical protein